MFDYTIQELGHLNALLGPALENAKQRRVESEQLALDTVRVLVARPMPKDVPERRAYYLRLIEAFKGSKAGSEIGLLQLQSTGWKYLEKLIERDNLQACMIGMLRNNLLCLALNEPDSRASARIMAEILETHLKNQQKKPSENAVERNIQLWYAGYLTENYELKYPPFLRFLHVLKDFYRRKHGNWTYKEITTLYAVLKAVKLPWEAGITLSDFLTGLLHEVDEIDIAEYMDLIDPAFDGETIETPFILDNISAPLYLALQRIAQGYTTTSEIIEGLIRKTGITKVSALQQTLHFFMNHQGVDMNQSYTPEYLAIEILGAQYLSSRLHFNVTNTQAGITRSYDPVSRFLISPDGQEVTDTHNGLIWRRCAEGIHYQENNITGNALAFTHEAALEHADREAARTGLSWRLPTVEELVGLVDRSRANPAINAKIFPGTPPKWFWTAAPNRGSTQNAWSVGFNYGYFNYVSRTNVMAIRLVRG